MPTIEDADGGERQRQIALDALELEEFAETAYDDLTRLAADICKTPIAMITLVDGQRQWFKSKQGVAATETPRAAAFCDHAIRHPDRMMVVEDASLDRRFADSPFVKGEEHIRFYAGAPLITSSGQAVGTLCVLDRQPRTIDAAQLAELRFLAQQVIATMERRQEEVNSRRGGLPAQL